MYLAGYALECALKEYLIVQEPGALRLSDVIQKWRSEGRNVPDLTGASGHSLPLLWSVTGLDAALEHDIERKRDLGICFRWKVTLRYGPPTEDPEFVHEFINAVERMFHWVNRRI